MSERPQAVREDGQEDLLEQIISQGLEKIKAPAREEAGRAAPEEEAPSASKQEGGGESTAPTARKSRRSAVYLYLLVLFGAAFLMLLLAYFIQQRSSESAISNLRDSMNLTRAELLDEIEDLKGQNTALQEKNNELEAQNAALQELYEALYAWDSFWMLEQYYQLENYEACAAVLLMQEQGQYDYRAPAAARQAEIVRAVVDAGILDEEYRSHPGDYQNLLTAYSQP